MLSEQEVKILELLNEQLLAKLSEIKSRAGSSEHNGIDIAVQRLVSMDCIRIIEPIGEKCFVITKKGTKNLQEAKNPEKKVVRKHEFILH